MVELRTRGMLKKLLLGREWKQRKNTFLIAKSLFSFFLSFSKNRKMNFKSSFRWFDDNQEDKLIERVLELSEAIDDDGPNGLINTIF